MGLGVLQTGLCIVVGGLSIGDGLRVRVGSMVLLRRLQIRSGVVRSVLCTLQIDVGVLGLAQSRVSLRLRRLKRWRVGAQGV